MLGAFRSLFTLQWTNKPIHHPLPDNVTRTFISTPMKPNDKLELLVSSPSPTTNKNNTPPILFLHGGFGNASVWLEFMSYLSSTTQCFAISYRNHGASYSVPYIRMVFGTTVSDLCTDILAAITHIKQTTGQSPILVAHSSAGGLSQYMLANNLTTTPALVTLDAVPHFGNIAVYTNWAKHDPWFMLRMVLHGYHVASPLSSINLVRGAFFGPGGGAAGSDTKPLTDGQVAEFERWMPRYESLTWPMQMYGSWWGWLTGRPSWLSAKQVVTNVVGRASTKDKICVMVGNKDVLMDVAMCRRAAGELRGAIEELKAQKKVDGPIEEADEVEEVEAGVTTESKGSVRFVVVEGAGHHSQNDVQWRAVAEALRKFVVQV